ncbi:MAG: hemerythrin domain-containing protein [Patescibacteria group bacterium]
MKRQRLVWTDDKNTGVPEIDGQHESFYGIANALSDFAEHPVIDKNGVRQAWEKLVDHIYKHFEEEEGLLKRRGYPKLKEHLAEHDKYREQIKKFFFRLHNSTTNLDSRQQAEAIADFANEWAVKHTLAAKQEAIIFLKKDRQ